MYVRKFEGDTLEDALRLVKMELGPDAIILKTVNNKCLRSAFKKKKFEITAAISENNYIKKAKVDSVLSNEQKQKFYNSDAGHVSKMINKYNGEKEVKKAPGAANGYGNLGLNKVVSQVTKSTDTIKGATAKTASRIKTSLDEFLSMEPAQEETVDVSSLNETSTFENELNESINIEDFSSQQETYNAYQQEEELSQEDYVKREVSRSLPRSHREEELASSIKSQQQKIEQLENQLFELTRSIQNSSQEDDKSEIYELRRTLKTLDLDESIIQRIIKKASFELSKEELNDQDSLFEFALRELNASIRVGHPLFSKLNKNNEAIFTVLVSEVSSGQTSMAYKLAKLASNSLVITYNKNQSEPTNDFAVKMLDINVVNATSISEIITYCRKANEKSQKVFIDFKGNGRDADETKKFIDSLNRSFNNVEVLVTLSAIHSEIFNRRIISKYQEMSRGVIISHIDLCLNFGALVNLQTVNDEMEFVFYGNGSVIPEDVEAATSERILAGMFQF